MCTVKAEKGSYGDRKQLSTGQNTIKKTPFLKNKILMFACCSTFKDLSIHVSFTTVGLILPKLG